ncbi:hypothetical protein [Streptomyces bikiniensis]|uniref:hypothetical protein n=1 Tax=Streptomyces bikiniensis TaxID=1896 RepID=UPI0004BF6BC8|nr:hypothetical protein [Streptomyces bikiniensis]
MRDDGGEADDAEFPEFYGGDGDDGDDGDEGADEQDGPEALEPVAFPGGAQEDRVLAAALLAVRHTALLAPVAASPWVGPVRDALVRAHSTAVVMLREGYGPGGEVGAFDIGLTRWMLAGAAGLPGAVRRPEAAVDGQLELARAVFDAVAHPGDGERFAGACELAERLAGPAAAEERALRARDLADLAAAREAGRRPDGAALEARSAVFGRVRADRVRAELRARGHRIGEVTTDFPVTATATAPVPVSERGAEVVRAIVAEMAGRFRVSEEEARRRVLAHFSDLDLADESDMGDLDHIDHQKPDQWAGSIYLGLEFHEVRWDVDLSTRTPVPEQPEQPEEQERPKGRHSPEE